LITVSKSPGTAGTLGVTSLLCLALAACGGGGGGDNATAVTPGGGPGAPYVVSGRISVAGSQTVDTDSNDPNQLDRRPNDGFDSLQPLPNPGQATGYLTVPGGGPAGAVSEAGDLVDGYSVRLLAGQVVELDFNADPAQVDIDLYLYDEQRQLVGRSIGTNSYECIRIAADGNYAVGVELYAQGSRSGSLYQLRVSPPGTVGCGRSQEAADAQIPGELVAVAMPTGADGSAPTLKAAADGLVVLDAGAAAAGGAMLLAVPQDPARLAVALAANAPLAPSAGPGSAAKAATNNAAATTAAATAAAVQSSAWRTGMSESARQLRAALELGKAMVASGRYRSVHPNFRIRQFADAILPFPPDDREYGRQRWHYEAIGLPSALQRLVGFAPASARPIVAVLDSGIVTDHPDLAGQLEAGYDFVTDPRNGDGDGADPDPNDPSTRAGSVFHGTHVAGTVAAQTYNAIGGAGVAPIARIMPVRTLSSEGGGTYFDLEQAIRFASGLPNSSGRTPAHRADILNLSLGASGLACEAGPQQLFNEVRAAGVMVVAASGNESKATETAPVGFPANCATVFAVAAVDGRHERARYSNVGPENFIAAPGGDSSQSTTGTGLPDGIYSTVATVGAGGRSPSYGYLVGTSMAAPHVAGVLALVKWVNPALPVATIEQWIREGRMVDELGAPGRDPSFGFGLVNADKAVLLALQSRGQDVPAPQPGQVIAQPSALNLGSLAQTVEFTLSLIGAAGESVSSVAVDSPVVRVAPKAGAVDAATNLGTYVVTANREAMAENTSAYPNVVIRLTPGRTLTLPVVIERRAGAGAGGSVGPVYVLVIDADDPQGRAVSQQVSVSGVDGVHSYAVTVPGTRRIHVIAGSDLDNDGNICTDGEACGAWPLLSGTLQTLEPTGDTGGIDFSVAPFGGVNPQGRGPAARPH
jgi:serine protease